MRWTKYMSLLAGLLGIGAGSTEAWACHVAEQVRVLPLGVVGGELRALQLEQHRDSETESAASIRWTVEPSIVALSSSGRRVIERRASLRLDDDSLDGRVASLYRHALRDARKKGAGDLKIVRDVDCRHLLRCEGVSFESGSGRLTSGNDARSERRRGGRRSRGGGAGGEERRRSQALVMRPSSARRSATWAS